MLVESGDETGRVPADLILAPRPDLHAHLVVLPLPVNKPFNYGECKERLT